ncbi:hypothetical protein [Actinokineospora diospyrosa]|uniref:DUF1877 family protein n=1 Tax=Actinokineospora diospyrosa TaxID=103728 RepID=A0ABT1IE64_9PSEU|nr:hypothetical protein [Actinokineospora diospyrosa]MCP2270920.1 hypothetical protein [Actinokineospora diospyrosa]
MGVLTDYFRAADAGVVVRYLELSEAASPVGEFDGVQAKSVDPDVVLGQLVAAALGGSYEDLDSRPVWPTSPPPTDVPEEGDPWAEGPWVSELDAPVRDALAGVSDVAAVTAVWVEAEEVFGEAAEWEPFVAELVALARRARDAGESLFCWVCL